MTDTNTEDEPLSRDITDLKRAEKALAENEAKMRGILDNIAIGVAIISPKMEILELNRRMREWFPAIDPDQHPVCYRAFNDPPREAVCDYCPTCKTLQDGLIHESTTQTPQGGVVRNYRIVSSPIIDTAGKVTAAIEMVEDITERLSLELQLRQAQKMEAMGTLAAGIAHDFNNILGIIFGYAELALMDSPRESPAGEQIGQVIKAAHRARDMVTQILAFSRQAEQELKPLKITPIVKETLKFLKDTLPATIEIRRHIQIERHGGDVVLADPSRIHQVIMNLCTNAAHAMREKSGILDLTVSEVRFGPDGSLPSPGLSPGSYVKLAVSDTGHGIEPAILNRIFEPYFTTKGIGEGTGLGLSVVHGIMSSLGGAVTVAAEPGKGTTFHLYFPVFGEEANEEDGPAAQLATGCEHILLVDDEPGLLETGRQILERLGYNVIARSNGIEALAAFQAHSNELDLIITDQTMPHMTGVEFAGMILQIRPDIPIILCTGFSHAITEEKAKAMGIRALAMKPLVASQLAGLIRRVLDENPKRV